MGQSSGWEPYEIALGRQLALEEIESVHHLNDFPSALLAEAFRLPSLLRRDFIRALVDHESRRFVGQFEEAVFDKGKDPKVWLRGGIIAPWCGTNAELGLRRVEEILLTPSCAMLHITLTAKSLAVPSPG